MSDPVVRSGPNAEDSSAGGQQPWGQQGTKPSNNRVTLRERRLVEGLPQWEPRPPGEAVIRRGS